MAKNSRRKGKTGELELAKKLSELFHAKVRRGVQYSGVEGKDVVGLQGVHIECKRVERMSARLDKALEQAGRDASRHEIPCVCHRSNNAAWQFTCWLDDLPHLVERLFLHLAAEDE